MWKIPENVNKLVELWKSGESASKIASVFNCTRSAVIGKIHRLGLNNSDRINLPPQAVRRPKKQVKPPEPRIWPKIEQSLPEPAPEPRRRPGSGVSILEVGWRQCRDIIDMHRAPDGLAMCCGEPTVNDGPWCSYHRARYTDQWRSRR